MSLPKQSLSIPFAVTLDQKTDPKQVMPTNMLELVNCVYTKDKQLTKRNGFQDLTQLPEGFTPLSLTTFKSNLTVVGSSLLAYNASNESWVDRGRYQGCELTVTSLAHSSLSKSNIDSCNANGWTCAVYLDSDGLYRFQVSDQTTSQLLLSPHLLPTSSKSARVFTIGNQFVITFMVTVTATPTLRYIAIPFANLTPAAPVSISSQVSSTDDAYDAIVFGGIMYVAWSGSGMGGDIRATRLAANLSPYTTTILATGTTAQLMSLQIDGGVWVSWYYEADTEVHALKTNFALVPTLTDTVVDDTQEVVQLTSQPIDGTLSIIVEVSNEYSFAAIRTDFISTMSIDSAGTVVAPTVVIRDLGLASKAFLYEERCYYLTVQSSTLQPTYFLCDLDGHIIAKLAYSNSGGYITSPVLPNVTLDGAVASIAHLRTDLLVSVSKTAGDPNSTNIYTQLGAAQAYFNLAPTKISSSEIASNLHLSGGYVWAYDGTFITEHSYHLWPENVALEEDDPGDMGAGSYQYVVTYEWTDSQGNIHRSAPSVPLSASVDADSAILLHIPTLRLTSKPDVRIVIYRWSALQQQFYQITSITSPLLNDKTVDSVDYRDTVADATILGNVLLYTTGGVVENIAYPATTSLALYKSRLMVLSSENPDVVWYSKQVFQNTPVEPSDLFTVYTAPSTGAQGSTGPTRVLSAMDDKFLMFKEDAIYYMVGDGPNDTGTAAGGGQGFSDPTFISSTVGSSNQQSLALTPQGTMFQSDKGIWILGRDLATNYIGAPVENDGLIGINSTLVIPNTNQVRFCLDDGRALMYDYYYGRWGTFNDIPSVAGTLYEQLHTYISDQGKIRQELPGSYLDGTQPVLISFSTAWINVAGVQGLERVYQCFLLATYITPHKLALDIYYDYALGPEQSLIISPDNYAGPYASDPTNYAQSGTYAGPGTLEQWQIFFTRQKIQSVRLAVQELFDPSFGTVAGEGVSFSGLNFVIGMKKPYPTLKANRSVS